MNPARLSPRGRILNAISASPTIRPRRCDKRKGGCGEMFTPARKMQKACCPRCASNMVDAKKAKDAQRAAAADKRQTKRRLAELEPIGKLEEKCRKIVQKIARLRDRDDGCISCHVGSDYGGIWHGSHYRAHGACSSLQFHLWNIHKACEQCNFFKGGNKEGFIRGLLVKPGYGRERLEWLDNQPKSKRFSRDYLLRFQRVMGKRMRRLEKARHQKSPKTMCAPSGLMPRELEKQLHQQTVQEVHDV